MTTIPHLFSLSCILALAAVPAQAHPDATARLVSCEAGDCVLLRGHRDTPLAAVLVNGRAVVTSRGTAWQVRLPVATVRDWSAPFARTLRVAVADAAGSFGRVNSVRLPVGLLGAKVELASLIVRAR